MKKVVNARGGAVLFFGERFFFFMASPGSLQGLYRGTVNLTAVFEMAGITGP